MHTQETQLNRAGLCLTTRTVFLAVSLLGAGCGGGGGGASPPPTFSVGGMISGLVSSGLTLTDNGGDALQVSANSTAFTFATAVASGGTFSVAVQSQPVGQNCTVGNGSGTIGSAAITNVTVTCHLNSYSIGGSISGLGLAGLVLANGADTLSPPAGATLFTMSSPVQYLANYSLVLQAQPAGLQCSVANGSGTMGTAAVTNISVTCKAGLGGTIAGLHASGLVLANSSDTVAGTCGTCFAALGPIATTVSTGGNYPVAIGINETTNKVYVVNRGSDSVTVIDGATNNTTMVAVGHFPEAIAVNAVTNKIYVANNNTDNVTVIDGATNAPLFIPLGAGTLPYAIAVNSVTNKVYVADNGVTFNTVIDPANNNATTNIPDPVPGGIYGIAVAVNPVTNKIYVTQQVGPGLTVIDGVSNTAANVPIGVGPYTVAVNPVTNTIYDGETGTVTVVSGASNTAIATIANNNTAAAALGVNAVTNKIYVADINASTVGVIDGATNLLTMIPMGACNCPNPQAIAVDSKTDLAYLSNSGSAGGNSLTVVDGPTNGTVSVPAGAAAFSLALNATTNRIYVANYLSHVAPPAGTVTVLDGTPFGSFLSTTPAPTIAGQRFTFATYLPASTSYNVVVQTQPTGQTCSVANGSGTMSGTPVTNIAVTCNDNYIAITGTITGLTGPGLVLADGNDTISFPTTVTGFTFPTPFALGASYTVAVQTQPTGQTCTLSNATGTISGGVSVQVTCK